MQKVKQITEEGLKKLEEELSYLKTIKRKEVVESIKIALSYGDLSENSEYDEAKNEQAKVEVRIHEIEELLKNVKVVDENDIDTEKISVGSKVRALNLNTNKEVIYSVVGSAEADPFAFKVSDESPVGKALTGGKRDEIVTYDTPAGKFKLRILDILK